MKKIYENFTEIAEDFKDGNHWTHTGSDHTPNDCFAWQHGVTEFAKFLDGCGVKIIENPEFYVKLWDSFKNYKPNSFIECSKAPAKG